jgi:predicted phosphodiesterase
MTTRIAIFSDLHGNSAATAAVLAAIDAEQPNAVYCLGDLVGYGALPASWPTRSGAGHQSVFQRPEPLCAVVHGAQYVIMDATLV